jgi:hypothetical protein
MHSLCTQRGNYSLPSNEPALMWLLRNNHKRECHEPRDKIYSLLSLASGNKSVGQKCKVDIEYDAYISSVFCSVMKGVSLRHDTIFAYGTALRRILKIYELPIPTGTSEQRGEIYIDVAGFVDGEVVEVIDLHDVRIEGEQSPGIPSVAASSAPRAVSAVNEKRVSFALGRRLACQEFVPRRPMVKSRKSAACLHWSKSEYQPRRT